MKTIPACDTYCQQAISSETQHYVPKPDALCSIVEQHLIRVQAVHDPAGVIGAMTVNGWRGPFHHPNRTDAAPSLWLKPGTATDAGSYHDQHTGAHGPLIELAESIGVDPRIGIIPPELRHKLPRARRRPTRRTWAAVVDHLIARKAGAV